MEVPEQLWPLLYFQAMEGEEEDWKLSLTRCHFLLEAGEVGVVRGLFGCRALQLS